MSYTQVAIGSGCSCISGDHPWLIIGHAPVATAAEMLLGSQTLMPLVASHGRLGDAAMMVARYKPPAKPSRFLNILRLNGEKLRDELEAAGSLGKFREANGVQSLKGKLMHLKKPSDQIQKLFGIADELFSTKAGQYIPVPQFAEASH